MQQTADTQKECVLLWRVVHNNTINYDEDDDYDDYDDYDDDDNNNNTQLTNWKFTQQKSTLYELSSELFVLFHRGGPRMALRLVNYPSTVYYQISTASPLFQKIIVKTN